MAFRKRRFYEDSNKLYFVSSGQGETMANQICVAVNTITGRWFNDGDVFDNESMPWICGDGRCADCANWLVKYLHDDEVTDILSSVKDVEDEYDYEGLLQDLCDICLDGELLDYYDQYPAEGNIFRCKGDFKVVYYDGENDDW